MILDNLQKASFRKASYLVTGSRTEGGRKTVTHEFPNTDRRQTEDLGLLNKTFSHTGIVKTLDNFDARNRLIEALERAGPGELVHPSFGTLTVTAKPYTMSESDAELGIARFVLTYEISQPPIFPAEDTVKPSLIASESDTVIDGIEDDVTETFEVSNKFATNYQAAKVKLQEIGNSFNIIGKTVSAITGDISEFSATVTTFTNNITTNITSPALIAGGIKDMFLQFDTLIPNARRQFDLATQLFGFGSDDAVIPSITFARTQKSDNQDILNGSMRGNALALAYNNAANIDYSNENELNDIRQALEAEYLDLTSDTNLSNDTLDNLSALRNSLRAFFEEISIVVPKIRTINTAKMPMSILTYQYYGSTEKTEDLIALNSTIDVSFVSGSQEILTP